MVVPEEHRKIYHKVNFDQGGIQLKKLFMDNWLDHRDFNEHFDRSFTYNEVARQIEQGSVLLRTTWKQDNDSSSDLDAESGHAEERFCQVI